jgi:hypothetical protein
MMKTSIKRLAERTDIPIENGRFIAENYRAVAALIDAPPHTVMHGDAHPGNMYFRRGGGTTGLAGGAARAPVARTRLQPDHQPHAGTPPHHSTRPAQSLTDGAGGGLRAGAG